MTAYSAQINGDGLGCVTCGGTGLLREPDPTDSPWFPKKPIRTICRDCDGTGRDPARGPT